MCPLCGDCFVEAAQFAHEDELIHHFHLFVEAALFGEVADLLEAITSEGFAEEVDGAGVGHGDADHHADAGGLACSVGPEKAEHGSGVDAQAQIFNGYFVFV